MNTRLVEYWCDQYADTTDTCHHQQQGIQQAPALADILNSALCCHSNETRVPDANPPNSAQLEGTTYQSPNLHPGPCTSVGMRRGTDTQTAVTNIHFASTTPHAKCNKLFSVEGTSMQLKPNSITLASSELAPNMFEAGSCQIPLH